MKKKVLKSFGVLALAAFVGLQGGAGTVWAAGPAVTGSGETVPGAVGGEGTDGEVLDGQSLKSGVSALGTDEGGEVGADLSEASAGTSDTAPESGESASDITGSDGDATGDGSDGSSSDMTGSGNNVSGGNGGSSSDATGSGNNVSGGNGGSSSDATGSGNNVSGGNGESVPGSSETGTPAEKTKLATPEISWDGWSLSWHDVAGAQGFYGVDIVTKKAGSEEWVRVSYPPTNDFTADSSGICRETNVIVHNIGVRNSKVPGFGGDDDNTVVRFRVQALDKNEIYEASEWSDWCEKVYSRPDQELKAPEIRWDEENPGLLRWTPVEGAMGYVVVAYDEAWNQRAYAQCGPDCQEYDFSRQIANWSVGKYYIHVRALSADIDVCANSDSGEIIYEVPSVAIGDALSEAMDVAKTDPRSAVGILMRKADMSELADAMQTDSNVLNQMKELERLYMEVSGNTVASPVVTETAKALLDASKINVAGAGFNGWNNAVSLQVGVVSSESEVEVPSGTYVRSVQLDIRLVVGDRFVSSPNLPVTITIPVPSGMDTGRLVIVHYGADGQREGVSFKDNGDGTVTFTVTHFSTFLFGEKESTENDDENPQGTPDNAQSDANPQSTPVSPKTGQESFAGFSTAVLLAALCGVAALVLFAGSRAWKRGRR